MSVELAHHGITVGDLRSAEAFFVDVLGFELGQRIDLDGEFSAAVTGVPGAVISVVFVSLPGLPVELLQYHGPDDRAPGTTSRPCDAGAAHLAMYVDDVQDVVLRAARHGWQPLGAVQPIVAGPRAGGLAVYLADAAGAVIELVQRP